MSWKDMMRRVLPPIDGVMPDITSRYGEVEGRPKNSTKPHRGVDFNYWGVAKLNRSNPAMRAPVTGIVTRADKGGFGTIAIRDADGFSHEILHSRAQHVTVGDPVDDLRISGQIDDVRRRRFLPGAGPVCSVEQEAALAKGQGASCVQRHPSLTAHPNNS